MAGVKGKSGLKKGQTNNPNGRPLGSKNKRPNPVKKLLEDFAVDKFDQFKKDFEAITNPYDRATLYLKIGIKLTPNPVSEEELDAIMQSQSALVNRLFRKDNEE